MLFNRNIKQQQPSVDKALSDPMVYKGTENKNRSLFILLPSALAVILIAALSVLVLYANFNGSYKRVKFSNEQFSILVPDSSSFIKTEQGASSVIWSLDDAGKLSLISVIIHPSGTIKIEDIKSSNSQVSLLTYYDKQAMQIKNYNESVIKSDGKDVLKYRYDIYESDKLKKSVWVMMLFTESQVAAVLIESSDNSKLSSIASEIQDSFELKPTNLELVE